MSRKKEPTIEEIYVTHFAGETLRFRRLDNEGQWMELIFYLDMDDYTVEVTLGTRDGQFDSMDEKALVLPATWSELGPLWHTAKLGPTRSRSFGNGQ